MLFVGSGLWSLNAGGRGLHDKHQTGSAAQAEFLAQGISRPALLTKVRNSSLMHSQEKAIFVLCTFYLVLCTLCFGNFATKHKALSTKFRALVFIKSSI